MNVNHPGLGSNHKMLLMQVQFRDKMEEHIKNEDKEVK